MHCQRKGFPSAGHNSSTWFTRGFYTHLHIHTYADMTHACAPMLVSLCHRDKDAPISTHQLIYSGTGVKPKGKRKVQRAMAVRLDWENIRVALPPVWIIRHTAVSWMFNDFWGRQKLNSQLWVMGIKTHTVAFLSSSLWPQSLFHGDEWLQTYKHELHNFSSPVPPGSIC